MLESFAVRAAVGTILGFLTGLGIGGGSLLILWLTLAMGMDIETARGINLLFFLPASAISCFFRQKHGCLEIRRCLPAILAGCACAAFATWIRTEIRIQMLQKGFGLLLLAAGLRELLYKPRH